MINRTPGTGDTPHVPITGSDDVDGSKAPGASPKPGNEGLTVTHHHTGPSLPEGAHDDFDVSGSAYSQLGKAIFGDYGKSVDILQLYTDIQAELHDVLKKRKDMAHEAMQKQLQSFNDATDLAISDLDKQSTENFGSDMWDVGIGAVGSAISAGVSRTDNQAGSMAMGSLTGAGQGIPKAFRAQNDTDHAATQKAADKETTNAQTFLSEFQDTVRDGKSAMSKSIADQTDTQSTFNNSLIKAADMS